MVSPLGASLLLPATRDAAGLHAALATAELVIGDFTGTLAMDAEAVACAPDLAFVQMPQVGVDSCDLPALTSAGVPVANTAGANARSVAEWAVGATFALCRSLAWADRRGRSGGGAPAAVPARRAPGAPPPRGGGSSSRAAAPAAPLPPPAPPTPGPSPR